MKANLIQPEQIQQATAMKHVVALENMETKRGHARHRTSPVRPERFLFLNYPELYNLAPQLI
jgi:hypothetical protein